MFLMQNFELYKKGLITPPSKTNRLGAMQKKGKKIAKFLDFFAKLASLVEAKRLVLRCRS